MGTPLPFFNWSLKKALATEQDNFVRARIRIIYFVLLFSLLKIFVVIGFGMASAQNIVVGRGIFALALYLTLAKALLYRPSALKALANIMIIFGILMVWGNIFVFAHKINLLTLQFAFMIILSSFYSLGNLMGIIYSTITVLPVFLFLLTGNDVSVYIANGPQEFASPGFEILVVLNFITILTVHYLFFDAMNVNIKEKEILNKELQAAIAAANQLAASKSDFLSTMSHELRTPLNSVIGIAELLREDRPEERQQENLKILHHSALDLLSLINNVLDFNKADSDKLTLEKEPFHLAGFMHDICSVLRVRANNKKLNLVLEIDERLTRTIIVSDATRLSQVIYNLVGNAIKFTEKGSVTVKVEMAGAIEHVTDVQFTVADTGIGIDPAQHEHVFNVFAQAGAHTMHRHGGSGLGLAIVKQLVTLFGSSIHMESEPGRGSRFYFTVPFATTTTAYTETVAATPAKETDISHLRILIAEDDNVNRIVLRKQLAKLSITPVIVENGKQALDTYLAGQFDLVFLDLHMPLSDGYETVAAIRALPDKQKANVFTVAFTASITEQQKIMDSGFNDFLYKPVNLNDLRDKLEKNHQRAMV